MWTMGSRGGWKARGGGESCWDGLEVGERSSWGCSQNGLEGRYSRRLASFNLGLDGDEQGDVAVTLGVRQGLLGTTTLPSDGISLDTDDMWSKRRGVGSLRLAGAGPTE